jgi:phenylalanyl-tRNA synthetase beta chain
MKIPFSLIKSYIDLNLDVTAIGETLTLLGIEVDKIIHPTPPFSGVVVGEVIEVKPHPNAGSLRVATVDDGTTHSTVVCGAPNCRVGIKTAYARCGADLSGKKIEKISLRGVESLGMLCSEEELSLEGGIDGIVELPLELENGLDLQKILWDPVFEISLTPNLGHCMSALGIARELSAALQIPLRGSERSVLQEEIPFPKEFAIEVEDFDRCPLYTCRYIEGVQIKPSPFWLSLVLKAAGMRSISNVVDISNYILLKTGQPLHMFDADQIEGKTLKIGLTKEKLPFEGLDGIGRETKENLLFIRDQQGIVAAAGVLGAMRGSTQNSTQNILIEAAYFDPKAIRSTMRMLDVRTESGHRFEKGIDLEGVEKGLDEAASLVLRVCGGKVSSKLVKQKKAFAQKHIDCRPARVVKILGTSISENEMVQIFNRLGFQCKKQEDLLQVQVPLYRSDITEEIDLIEEVARIYGYNQLGKGSSHFAASHIPHDPSYLFEKEIRARLIGLGAQEFLTSDLSSPKNALAVHEWLKKDVELLKALKPKTEEYSVLRASLLPGLLEVANFNFNQKNFDITAFEIGNIHLLQKNELLEEPMLALLLSGKKGASHWSLKREEVDFYDLKGKIETLLEPYPEIEVSFTPADHPSFHPYIQANLMAGELLIGSLGQVHPLLLEKFGIKHPIFYAEINLHSLRDDAKKGMKMAPLAKFPGSDRDWTLTLQKKETIQSVFDAIEKKKSALLEKFELIDLYTKEGTEEKMATFRFFYKDPLKTVSFEEVEKVHFELISQVLLQLSSSQKLTS